MCAGNRNSTVSDLLVAGASSMGVGLNGNWSSSSRHCLRCLFCSFAAWAIRSVLAADQGTPRMQEIAGAIREGASAYLTRQYSTIALVGVVVFLAVWYLLSITAGIGFLIGLFSPG